MLSLKTVSADDLFTCIEQSKYHNMQTRYKRKDGFYYLNGLKLSGNVIKGYVYFSDHVEIRYEIRKNGNIAVTMPKNLEQVNTEKLFTMIEKKFKERLNQVYSSNIRANYSSGEYYLRRSSSNKLGKKAKRAIEQGVFSASFLKQMAAWNLGLINPD